MSWLAKLPPAVRALVDDVLAADGAGRSVVFDADGTLWRGDVGEDLLRYLAATRALFGRNEGVYAQYERLNAVDAPRSYALAVEVMAGLEESWLTQTCATFFTQRFAGRVFPYARPFIAALKARGYAVWLCSASPRWAVAAAAPHFGLERGQVIGVESVVENGLLTARVRPVTAGPGKVSALKERGLAPVLAVGNGWLDLDMLRFAKRALVIAPPDEDTPLAVEARGRGWPILRV